MNDTDDVSALLSRTNELLSILVKAQLGPVLERETERLEHRKLYALTGGDLPVNEISKKIGLSTGTISALWSRWEQLGLLVKKGQRYRRVFE